MEKGEREAINEEYKACLYRRDGVYTYRDKNGEFQAEIADIEENGHLLLRDAAGHLRRYAFKEVQFVLQ